MKKLLILMILMILALPMALGVTYISDTVTTEFNMPFIQDKCYSKGDGNCFTRSSYSLRSVADSENTGIDYNDPSFDSCSVLNGGSVFRGFPLSYRDDTGYQHYSYIAVKSNTIKQINADCSIADTYTVNGLILSEVAVINSGEIGTNVSIPYFAYLYNNSDDSLIYINVLTLSDSTSKFISVADVLVGNDTTWGDRTDIIGMAGGCISSSINSCSISDMVFGVYTKHNSHLLVTYGDKFGTSEYFENAIVETSTISFSSTTGNDHLYFDDYDNDGYNEFILMGMKSGVDAGSVTFELARVTVSKEAPFLVKLDTKTNGWGLTGGGSCAGGIGVNDGDMTLCQVGDVNSPLEVCFTGMVSRSACVDYSSTLRYFTGFLYEDFDQMALISYSDYYPHISNYFIKPFTMGDIDKYFCSSATDGGYFGYIECIDYDLNTMFYINMTDWTPLETQGNAYTSNFIVADIDGNSSNKEFIFTDGTIQSFELDSNTSVLTDWDASLSHTDAYMQGYIYVQDISGDGISEIIYTDDTILKIYSMNSSPFIFEDASSYLGVTTTTTSAVVTTTTIANYDPNVPVIYTQINNNIQYIFALFLILGLAIFSAIMTKSTIIGIIGAFVGTVLSVMLGLISTGLLVIILVFMVLIAIIGFFYKGGN